MAIQTEPSRIQIPFADSGTKNTIPATNSSPSASQAASWTDGFPTQCSLPLASGGIPPARADFNGIFNTMSQSIRFGQEGGIWAWDATVDYAANRVVLGSDGLLYWSVAQSGPNVGGAQNPTTDTSHTYWGTMPMVSPGVLDVSSKLATTKWVHDAIGPASLYVDPANGNNANDGLTQAKAVKTITQALALANTRFGEQTKIYLTAGTYTESLSFYDTPFVSFVLQGNVTISGNIIISRTEIQINGNYTLTVTSTSGNCVEVINSGAIFCGVDIVINASNGEAGIRINRNAVGLFTKTTTINCSNITGSALYATNSGMFILQGAVYVSGSNVPRGIFSTYNGIFLLSGGFSSDQAFASVAINAVSRGVVNFQGGVYEIKNGSQGSIIADRGSYIEITNSTINIYVDSSKIGITSYMGSIVSIGKATISISGSSVGSFFRIVNESCLQIVDSSTLDINGSVTAASVQCFLNSLVVIDSSDTVTGTVTGKRYDVSSGSQINVYGTGANRIPGTVAGTVSSATFGYYG